MPNNAGTGNGLVECERFTVQQALRFAHEAGEDAETENCDAAKQISDVRDRKLLPGPSLSNQCAANVPQDLQTREFFEAFEAPRNLPCELLLWVRN